MTKIKSSKDKSSAIPTFQVLSAAVLWGFIGLSVRPLGALGLNAVDLTLVRSIATFLGVLAMILATDCKRLTVRFRDLWIFFGSGVMSIVFFNVCYFITQQIFTLSLSSVFIYTAPFFVVILSALIFRERITVRKLCALFAAFGGCVLVSGVLGGGKVELTAGGTLIGLGSGIGYALYSIFGRLAMKRYHCLTFMLYTFFIAALALTPFADVCRIADAFISGGAPYLALFGIAFTMLPYILYTRGLEKMSAGRASILAFAEPMVATAAGFIFFGEKPSAASVAGIALIFGAVVILNTNSDN